MCWDGITCLKPCAWSQPGALDSPCSAKAATHFILIIFQVCMPCWGWKAKLWRKKEIKPAGSDCEESQQVTHSILASWGTHWLQTLGKRAKVLINCHLVLLVRRSGSKCVGGLWCTRRIRFSTHEAGSELTLEKLSSCEWNWFSEHVLNTNTMNNLSTRANRK